MIARMQDCPRCGAPLVAVRSRRIGLCSGCVAQVEAAPVEAGDIRHRKDCTGGGVERYDLVRRSVIICTGCGSLVSVRRRNEWRG